MIALLHGEHSCSCFPRFPDVNALVSGCLFSFGTFALGDDTKVFNTAREWYRDLFKANDSQIPMEHIT